MKKLMMIASLLMIIGLISAQTTVFSDDFSTNQSATWTTSGQVGTSSFYVNRSGADWGARRNTSPAQLEVTNDASGASNVAGWAFAYTSTGGFASPYNSTLSSNPGLVTWYFNIRVNRANLAGFASGSYGLAFILGSTSTSPYNAGSGYALVLGNSSTPDPFRLAKFNNGLSGTLTNVITGSTNIGTNYYSIKVTYDPATNGWELLTRDDGSSSFADPMSGSLTSAGTGTDATYTSTALSYTGGYWAGSTSANQIAFFDNYTITVVPGETGTPTITTTGVPLSNFGGILVGNSSDSQSYTVSGEDLEGDIEIYAPGGFDISDDDSSWTTELFLSPTGGVVDETTIYVRFSPTAVQAYTGNIEHYSSGAAAVNVAVAGTGLKSQPSNHPSDFAAADGTIPASDILVSWTDATGTVIPDGYLIKGSNVGYSSITDPIDGVAEANGLLVQNVASGVQSHNFTYLNSGTTYFFKIYSFTNSGSDINYKLDGTIQTASHTTAVGPALSEVILPQYMQGLNGTNNQRIPWASRLTLENLNPSATYRYYGMFVEAADGATSNGAGIPWFVTTSGTISRSTTGSLSTTGQYGEFTTDANGDYTGWFMGEPSGNARFVPGNNLWFRLMINDGNNGTAIALRLTTTNTIKVINFGTQENVNQGTFLYGVSGSPAKNFCFVYDNEAGTGRPIAGTIIESDGLSLTGVTQILPAYRNNVDGVEGAWGLIIPNSVGTKGFTGIKRVESRELSDGSIYAQNTDADGNWNGVDTTNPTGGDSTPLDLSGEATLPVELSSFTATLTSQNTVNIMWVTQTETNVNGYYVYRGSSSELNAAAAVSSLIGAYNTSQQQVYQFTDTEVFEPGTYYYWLQVQDLDGSIQFHGPTTVYFDNEGNNGTPVIPKVTELKSIYPNPFNPSTTIYYSLAKAETVDFVIYNNRGQIVRSFNEGNKGIGNHSLRWNGEDQYGRSCSTGIYYIKMTAGKDSFIRKAVLMK